MAQDLMYPVTILRDRYQGTYSGAQWTAWNHDLGEMPIGAWGSDDVCAEFWSQYVCDDVPNCTIVHKSPVYIVGKGRDPLAAFRDLQRKLDAKPNS